ncbi:MAG: glycosyltransferase [Methylomarinum sp.]|nr:glycosyltransferase [Methylomarinum sp.]
MDKVKTLSVVIPAYNEEETIKGTVLKIIEEVKGIDVKLIVVLVDDGSTDGSWVEISKLAKDFPGLIVGVKFSRNYGKDCAVLAGIESVSTDLYLVIDADGEHPVEKISEFYSNYQSGDCDVVHGIKKNRRGSRTSKFMSRLFNKTFKYFANIDITESSDFKLFNDKFKRALLNYGDYDFFFRAAAQDVGFQSKKVDFDEKERIFGVSSWGNRRLFKYAFDSIVNYSHYPLFFILFLGVISVLLGGLVGVKALVDSLTGSVPEGYLTLLVLDLVSLGMIMTAVGIVGVYLSKIFDEVKGRPRYLVEQRVEYEVDVV